MTETTYTEPIIAYRRWNVSEQGQLVGIGFSTPWLGKYMQAECKGSYLYVAQLHEGKSVYASLDEFVSRLPGISRVQIALSGSRTSIQQITLDGKDVTQFLSKDLIGARVISTCRIGKDCPVEHESPHYYSHCGVYAHNLPIAECKCGYMTAFDHGVIGVVRLWGRVIEHELGFRAEHAEIAGVVDLSYGQFNNKVYGVRVFPDLDSLYHEWTPDWDPRRDGYSEGHEESYCGSPLTSLPPAFHTIQVTFAGHKKKDIDRFYHRILRLSQWTIHGMEDFPYQMKWTRPPRLLSHLRPTGQIAWRDPRNDNLIELIGERGARWTPPDGSLPIVAQ